MAATDCGGFHATTYSSETVQLAADAANPADGTAAAMGSAAAEALPSVEGVEIVAEAMPYFRPYSPATIMCNTLDAVHTMTGLPWWATIAVCTVTARTALLPVIVYTMKNGAKMALMKPEMDAVQARFKAEQRTDPTAQERFQRDAQDLMKKYDVHPARMLLGPISQAPIFISFFMATRRLADHNPTVAAEGFLWVPSMAEADPLYILPVCASITMLTIAQLGGDTGNEQQKEQMEKFKKVMSIAAIGVFPLTYWMPSLTFAYWISSNSFSCFQVPLMKRPAVKQALGIPIVPTTESGALHRSEENGLDACGVALATRVSDAVGSFDLALASFHTERSCLLVDTEKKPVTAAEVKVPGASVHKYAHPGSFKPVSTETSSAEVQSPVLDAEFTEVQSGDSATGKATTRRRRRKPKGKRR